MDTDFGLVIGALQMFCLAFGIVLVAAEYYWLATLFTAVAAVAAGINCRHYWEAPYYAAVSFVVICSIVAVMLIICLGLAVRAHKQKHRPRHVRSRANVPLDSTKILKLPELTDDTQAHETRRPSPRGYVTHLQLREPRQ